MVRRGNVLANTRNSRNQVQPRNNQRNRTRNRNSLANNNPTNRRNVRRVFKNRNFKGASGGLNRRSGGGNQNDGGGQNSGNNRRNRFRRKSRNFGSRRFNSSFRSKQNFKKNKDSKTVDQMDMELDSYMGGEAAKARMDADLNKYFTQPEGSSEK